MAGAPPLRNVAVFVDLENLFGGYGKDVTSVPLGSVVREIELLIRKREFGGLTAMVRAYANWGRADMAGYRKELLEYGVEPVQIFSFDQRTRNAADIELVIDALEVAAEKPWIDVFVIVSGDGGFVPLIRRLHDLGKHAVVVTTSQKNAGGINPLLRSVADHFHVIDVPSPTQRVEAAQQPANLADDTARSAPKKKNDPAANLPAVDLYKASVHAFLKDDRTLLRNGCVDGARLGNLLRERWPDVTYRTFGFGSLARFIEDGCGLKLYRPAPAKPKQAGPSVVAKP